MKIKSITHNHYDTPKEFYGIYSSDTGNYVSNGLVSKNCGMMDEMDFFSTNSVKKDIFNLYNQIRSRVESRFISRGLIRNSKLILLSSKRSNSDFLESYINKVKSDPRRAKQLYLVDRPIWEVKTQDYPLNGPTFSVAVGSRSLPSQMIEESEEQTYRDQGYRIIKVPESLRLSFESDINLALQDKAGIALDNTLKFLPTSKIDKAFNKEVVSNPFSVEIIITSLDDERGIKDYIDLDILRSNTEGQRLYIHCDLAFAKDRLGLAGSILKTADTTNKVGGKEVRTMKVYPQPVFYVALKSERGQEINLNSVPDFIKTLDELGFDIGRVSADSFQSKSILQDLRKYDSITMSVDRPTTAYDYFKNLLHSELIGLYKHELLNFELNDVIHDIVANKVDHTREGCLTPDTMIRTVNRGSVMIKDLLEDDLLYAYSDFTNSLTTTNFTNLRITKYVDEIYVVKTYDDREIHCTGNHPILTTNGYVPADELSSSHRLVSFGNEDNMYFNQSNILIKSSVKVKEVIKIEVDNLPVYDIEVPNLENFMLDNNLIVHNSKDLSDAVVGSCYNAITSPEATELSQSYSMNYEYIDTNNKSSIVGDMKSQVEDIIKTDNNLSGDTMISSDYDDIFSIFEGN